MTDASPKETAAAFFDALMSKDLGGLRRLLTDDVNGLLPFAPTGFPDRIVGLEQVSQFFEGLFGQVETMLLYDFDMHVADSGMLFAFCKSKAKFVNGRDYANSYIFAFRFKDGKISEYSEYSDPRPVEKVLAQ